jgi:hypothetical protein
LTGTIGKLPLLINDSKLTTSLFSRPGRHRHQTTTLCRHR